MSRKRKHVEIKFEFEIEEKKLSTFKEQYKLIEKHREKKDAPVDLYEQKKKIFLKLFSDLEQKQLQMIL